MRSFEYKVIYSGRDQDLEGEINAAAAEGFYFRDMYYFNSRFFVVMEKDPYSGEELIQEKPKKKEILTLPEVPTVFESAPQQPEE